MSKKKNKKKLHNRFDEDEVSRKRTEKQRDVEIKNSRKNKKNVLDNAV